MATSGKGRWEGQLVLVVPCSFLRFAFWVIWYVRQICKQDFTSPDKLLFFVCFLSICQLTNQWQNLNRGELAV